MSSSQQRTRLVNPRLGTYFAISSSAFVALGLLALIFEHMGISDHLLRWSLLLAPPALYVGIGLASWTEEPLDYFAAGRRVPAFFSGLGLAMSAIGGTGLVGITGLFFLNGFDAWCVANGLTAGFVAMAILIAPYYRKVGQFTVPSYLGRRFESRTLRVAAAAILAVPMLLVIIAELRIGMYAASWLATAAGQAGGQGGLPTGQPTVALGLLLAVTVAAALTLGGMRAAGWSGTAAAIAAVIALLVPSVIVALMATNLPLPQFSHGPLLRVIGRIEAQSGLPIVQLPAFAFELAGQNFETLARRSTRPFGSVGVASYILTGLTLMLGVAAAPWLLPRTSITPGVYETRKSLGWGMVVLGLLLLTCAGSAVFLRDIVMELLVGKAPADLPAWFNSLVAHGAASFDSSSGRLQPGQLDFKRDAALLALPLAAGLPASLLYLALAGIVAAAVTGACTAVLALATLIAEDGVNGMRWDPLPPRARLAVVRIAIVAVTSAGTAAAVLVPADPLMLLLWAFAISGGAAFPVLFLSIWWKRLNTFGALAGLVAGFAVAVLAILAGQNGWYGIHSVMAGVFAVPAGFAAAIGTAYLTPQPGRQVLEAVRDMRVPGGETLHDREQRLARLKQRQQQS
jgi:cation/acetate symporter